MIDLVLIVAELAPLIIIFSGPFCSQWLLERLLSVTNIQWEPNFDLIMKISFFVGIVDFITAACYIAKKFLSLNPLVIALLIAAGIVLTLRPLRDFQFAKWIALIAAGISFLILFFFNFIIAAIIFAPIVFLIVYLRIKFPETIFDTILGVVTNPFIATILSILCIVLGIILLFFG